jgi:peptide/nickel transport system ATP-binding protein
MSELVLQVKDLNVSFSTVDGVVQAVNGISFDVRKGQTLGIVGESGSGKSVTASAIMGLINKKSADMSGSILLGGLDVLTAQEREIRALRGREAAMVFQDPMSALNPYYTVGKQIAEAYEVHHPKSTKKERQLIALDMLAKVGLPKPSECIDEYPHQFSGGMRQRIVIAIALVNNPRLLIADEPTTALDVTVQAQILELMMNLQQEFGSAIILITHDLGVVAEVADEVMVMYAGQTMESSKVQTLFDTPSHPYTRGLLGSVRSLDNSERGALHTIAGNPPSMISLPGGCPFHPRCEFSAAMNGLCATVQPSLRVLPATGSESACHLNDAQLLSLGRGISHD